MQELDIRRQFKMIWKQIEILVDQVTDLQKQQQPIIDSQHNGQEHGNEQSTEETISELSQLHN